MKRYDYLIELIAQHSVESMLEIGVGCGVTMDTILNYYPSMSYTGIDPYKEYPNDVNGTRARVESNRMSAMEAEQKHIDKKESCLLIKRSSSEMADIFGRLPKANQPRYDLIFIDGEHTYSAVGSDSYNWWHFLKQGGIMVWHDYTRPEMFPGVKKAVDEFPPANVVLYNIGDLVYVIKCD